MAGFIPSEPEKWLSGIGFYLKLMLVSCVVYGVVTLFAMGFLRWFDPPITALQVERLIESGRVADPAVPARWVPLADIPLHVRHAVIAAEDTRFLQHDGIDWEELEEVLSESWKAGRVTRGASTITQQLVKNLFLTSDPSVSRKAIEVVLAPAADWILPKDRVLEIYLNVVEWGEGVYGIEAAAQFHFGTSAVRLTRDQAARLAACLPAPRRRRPARMDRYSYIILRRMEALGW